MKRRNIRAKDLLQLPSAITAGSFALVVDGSRKLDTPEGKAEVIVGRLGDVVDGAVARKLDMSSDAGAMLDVLCDKLGMAAIGVGAWRHDIVPKPILLAMAARHGISAAATLYAGLHDEKKRAIRPPLSGKLGMAADTAALSAFMLASELAPDSRRRRIATGVGHVAAAAGLIFGTVATVHYIKGEFATDET